jgi:dipeptidyl aminopeptidase/acylaminoacyl peptidase
MTLRLALAAGCLVGASACAVCTAQSGNQRGAARGARSAGTVAYARDSYWGNFVSVADVAGNDRVQITPRPTRATAASDHGPAWSPDGGRVAFVSEVGGNYDPGHAPRSSLYVANRDGTGLRLIQRLGTTAGDFTQQIDAPAWSRDGSRIAFASGPLWVIDSDGTQGRQLVRSSTCSPDWSPNGRTLVYLVDPEPCQERGSLVAAPGYRAIDRIDADGTNHRQLARGSFGDVAWSPDGTRIAYTANCEVRHGGDWSCDVYLMNADGSNKRLLVENTFGCGCVAWIAHGKEVLWNNVGTFATNITTGARHTLFRKPGSPAGISSSGATVAIAGWGNGPITIVTSAGRRIRRVKVPRGWTYAQTAVYLAR